MNRFAHQSIEGVGIGLRSQHYQTILTTLPQVAWFEVLSENYLSNRALVLSHLLKIREHYPVTLHGVGLSIGSVDPLNKDYLKALKSLAATLEPAWISDHLSWVSLKGHYHPDLFPLPHTQQAITHVVQRVKQVQDFLGRQILLENVARYLNYQCSEISESEFLKEVATQSDCYLLLDINNVYVNAYNHQFCALDYLKMLPSSRVKQFHLGGYQVEANYLLDSHSQKVTPQVWELFTHALKLFGKIPTSIEWDNNIPPLATLLEEMHKAQAMMSN